MIGEKDFLSLGEQLNTLVPEFDLVIVADGSGTTASEPCGFRAYTYWPAVQTVKTFTGAASHGSNNYAELAPFLLVLTYAQSLLDNTFPAPRTQHNVLCVSDSELTVKCASNVYKPSKNMAMWEQLRWYEKNGFNFLWQHVPRNSNPINLACDEFAGKVRRQLATFLNS